ncbi:MAG TPA: ATP-binding protein, partial [Burkholderiales bacterium]|nr:ATP-binding protein [Burkholderiales bacterium]
MGAVMVVHGLDLARWLGYADYDNLLLTSYGTFFLILALGATVIARHVQAVERLDRSNRTLELEVAAKVHEIEESYLRMQAMMREQAVLRERQRIMGDMHDGLGSSLVSMLALVQSGRVTTEEIERRLNASIIELRAIVDSLEPVDGDLAAVLGNVRYRMRAALEQSGARVLWNVDDLPRLEHLTPQMILSIERILLEVLSNALQHSGAGTISFDAHVSEDGAGIVIRVADDGSGFDRATNGNGRGLRSMNERARRAGLSVDIASTSDGRKGTVVTLTVPMHAAAAADIRATVTA